MNNRHDQLITEIEKSQKKYQAFYRTIGGVLGFFSGLSAGGIGYGAYLVNQFRTQKSAELSEIQNEYNTYNNNHNSSTHLGTGPVCTETFSISSTPRACDINNMECQPLVKCNPHSDFGPGEDDDDFIDSTCVDILSKFQEKKCETSGRGTGLVVGGVFAGPIFLCALLACAKKSAQSTVSILDSGLILNLYSLYTEKGGQLSKEEFKHLKISEMKSILFERKNSVVEEDDKSALESIVQVPLVTNARK